jgi:hypothetical protein
MKFITESKAHAFTPSTVADKTAAASFIEAANTWGEKRAEAENGLRDYLRETCQAKVHAFTANDPLNMSVFGVIFESNPGPGFLAFPRASADKLSDMGVRGYGFFPDSTHPIGKQVFARMNAISRVAEGRPLLSNISGVKSVAIEDGKLVLTRATVVDGAMHIMAALGAVSPSAEIKPVVAPLEKAAIPAASPKLETPRVSTRRPK